MKRSDRAVDTRRAASRSGMLPLHLLVFACVLAAACTDATPESSQATPTVTSPVETTLPLAEDPPPPREDLWDPSASYESGAIVLHSGRQWIAEGATLGLEPGSDPLPALDPVGFGAQSIGDDPRSVAWVTNLDNSGEGSLRWAASSPDRHIIFLVAGEIRLESPVEISSNVIVDGRGRQIDITGYGLSVNGSRNVVITHLSFDEGVNRRDTDAIRIIEGSTDVWVDHVSITGFIDGAIDVTRDSDRVTISSSKITDFGKAILIDPENPDAGWADTRISLVRNWFVRVEQRSPLVKRGLVHQVNNVLQEWNFYAARAVDGGLIISEGNWLEARDGALEAILTRPDPAFDDARGSLVELGNVYVNGAFSNAAMESSPPLIPEWAAVSAQAIDADLAQAIRDEAGWQEAPGLSAWRRVD